MKKLFAVFALLIAALPLRAAPRPNVIFILADDLGAHDVGCYGSTFHETPNIDALARRGVKFTNAYAASPLCSPTRSSLLTGLYPARIGITAPVCHAPHVQLEKRLVAGRPPDDKAINADSLTRLKSDYFTLPEAMKEAGYATAHFGKWHLGFNQTKDEHYEPKDQGYVFDFPHTPILRRDAAQRNPGSDEAGGSGLCGNPGLGSPSLYSFGATSFGASAWKSEARCWIWLRPGPSSNWPPP